MKKTLVRLFSICLIAASHAVSQGQIQVNDPEPNELEEYVLDFGCRLSGSTSTDFVEIQSVEGEILVSFEILDQVPADSFALQLSSPQGVSEVAPLEIPIQFTSPNSNVNATACLVITAMGQQLEIQLIGTSTNDVEDPCVFETILAFLDESIINGDIVGTGNDNQSDKRLAAMRKRLETIDFLIQNGNLAAALAVTNSAIKRSDGDLSQPGDFIEDGPNSQADATQTLNDSLVFLVGALGG